MSKTMERDALKRTVTMADGLAEAARIYVPQALPVDVDWTPSQVADFELYLDQISEPHFSREASELVYLAFSAKHLPALVSTLRALSPTTQPRARSILIQLLAFLPNPDQRNHYFRKFLTSPLAVGLPDFVASAFADGDGLEWMQRHSGPGYVCSLLSHMVRWCDVAMGDDKQAAISLPQRTAVLRKIADIRADEAAFKSLDKRQRELEIPFLEGTLKQVNAFIEINPHHPASFILSQRSHLEGRIPGVAYCGLDTCMEDTEDDELQACSRCKMVKYCGRECQTKAWKTHKFRCFAPTF